MLRNRWFAIFLMALIIGGIGGVLFNRFVVPWLASMPGLSALHKLESNNPVVINRKEEVTINEGVNMADLARQAGSYTVGIYTGSQPSLKFAANGIIVSSDGLIVTSKAAIPPSGAVTVVTNDGSSYSGTIRALDPRSEIAVLTISASNLPFAQFADASSLSASQRLIYLGRSNAGFTHNFAQGIVTVPISNSASLERVFSSEVLENGIAVDARLNSDFVGGPVINFDGRVVGMTASNLAVIIGENLQTATTTFLQNGKIVRPEFGIKYLNLSDSLAKLRGLSAGGLLVLGVDFGSPAQKAGIQANDLLISIDNQALPSGNFEKIINQHSGLVLPVTVLRAGNRVDLSVSLGAK